MRFDLSDDHKLIQETVRDFATAEIAPVAEDLDREKRFPYEIVAKLGELGLMGIPFPEEYGGAAGDSLAYAIAVEELTRVDSSVAITMYAHPRGARGRRVGRQRRQAVHHERGDRYLGPRRDHGAHGRRRDLEPHRRE